jgi:hypothetical protein
VKQKMPAPGAQLGQKTRKSDVTNGVMPFTYKR